MGLPHKTTEIPSVKGYQCKCGLRVDIFGCNIICCTHNYSSECPYSVTEVDFNCCATEQDVTVCAETGDGGQNNVNMNFIAPLDSYVNFNLIAITAYADYLKVISINWKLLQ